MSTDEKNIDAFQRKLFRMALKDCWHCKIYKEDIYYKKKYEPWSKTIKRMFIFLGDIMRLHKETPVSKVLE